VEKDRDAKAAMNFIGEITRARVSGCSVPSIFSGRPTITASGCHS
jgi:hypothetical protein